MKKIITIILLFILMFDLSGHVLIFIKLQKDINKEIKSAVFEKIPLSELETFIIHKGQIPKGIDFLHSKEFRFQNKLYDIIKRDTVINKEILFCVRDTNEEFLLHRYSSLISAKIKDFESKFSGIPIFIIKTFISKIKPQKIYFTAFQILNISFHSLLEGINTQADQPPEFI